MTTSISGSLVYGLFAMGGGSSVRSDRPFLSNTTLRRGLRRGSPFIIVVVINID